MNRTSHARPTPPAFDAQNDDAGGDAPSRPSPPSRGARTPRATLPTRVDDLPDLPTGYERVLDAGLDELGLRLEPRERRRLGDQARLLIAWTAAVNLTAIRDPEAVARLHVLDSLTAVTELRARGADRFLDLGSGGGYPGLPLATVVPAAALLVESIGKKARFLDAVVEATGLGGRVAVAARRAEALAADVAHRERWPLVTARAVADLGELVELAFPLLVTGGTLVAWKRDPTADELAAGRRAARALGGGRIAVREVTTELLPGHCLVLVEKRGPTPPGYPRDPARRLRRPW